MNQTLITCEYCKREWDGNAQCPCWMELSFSCSDSDNEEDIKTPEVKKKIQPEKTPLELGQAAVNEMFIIKYNLR